MFGKKNHSPRHQSDFFLGEMERQHARPAEEEKKPPLQKTEAPSPAPNQTEPAEAKTERKAEPLKKLLAGITRTAGDTRRTASETLARLLPKKTANDAKKAEAAETAPETTTPKATEDTPAAEKEGTAPASEKPAGAARPSRRAARDVSSLFSRAPLERAPLKEEKKPATDAAPKVAAPAKTGDVAQSLDGMYGVHRDGAGQKKKPLSSWDAARYAVLFCCIFGFLFAGYFVFGKLYDYYRAWQVNTELQSLVEKKDLFADDYMKKLSAAIPSLTPQDILNGKTAEGEGGAGGFSAEQENILSKIAQLKNINSDTVGWITIEGTVVNYPVVWSGIKNYYLHRDFYKKPLSGGTIYVDERNSSKLSENRNTVFYGHNMSDGSMFASLHDFQSATLFYDATIQLATSEGIFIYKPFSVHQADAYDNYFETNFQNDSDFIQFCEDMQFLSIFETEYTFTENSRIITLSTCMDNESATDDRFAVHAVLTQVIR
ncbi:MAG: class B sortase [Clostridia bacterium]|nr:class B sortase [Clostridia bacterium]